ncbi:MAG: MCE family protein [Rhizobiales bacterium]|nr:MCE family protein [Hyphomicrobiales bacterium]
METRANYILIGLFTLGVIMGAFGFVYWFHHVGGTGERTAYHVVFKGPIGGLRTGAAVSFNGIRVGEVAELGLDPENPKQALATISIDTNTPVRADTTVSLDFQGLTGIATLALRGGSVNSPRLEGKDGALPVLVSDFGSTADMMQAARDVLGKIDTVIEQNQVALRNSIKSIETFTEALARNSEKVDRIMAGIDNLIGGPEGKGDIPEAVRAIRTTAENLDKRIDGLVSDGRRTLNTIEKTVKNFDENPQRLIFGGGRPANTGAPSRNTTGTIQR